MNIRNSVPNYRPQRNPTESPPTAESIEEAKAAFAELGVFPDTQLVDQDGDAWEIREMRKNFYSISLTLRCVTNEKKREIGRIYEVESLKQRLDDKTYTIKE